jgi:hypothetical protein
MNSPIQGKIFVSTLLEWNLLQLEEMLSPLNVFATGMEVGHPPTPEECQLHYDAHGGSEHFRETHIKGWLIKQKQDEAA